MRSKWTTCRIKDVLSFVVDNRGKTPPTQDEGFELLEVNAVSATEKYPQYQVVRKRVSEEVYNSWFRSGHPRIGDILVPTVGTLGAVAFVNKNDCCIAQNLIALRTNPDICDCNYLYYILCNPFTRKRLLNLNIGGVQPSIKVPHLMGLEIELPDIETQKKIGNLLQVLDEKIATNQKINENLEQQIRSLFRVRFTDNPALEKMKQVPLSDLCQIVTKGTTPTTLGKPFVKSGINFIKAESILDSHAIDKSKFAFIDEETNTLLKRSVIKAGDIVFTIAGTLGRFALIDKNVLPANTNQAVAIIRADVEKVLPEYIYACFIGEWHNHYYTKRVQQAVQANLSLTTIKSLPIPLLDESEMVNFTKLIIPLIKMIKQNEVQNETLTSMRDTLLPKLMSGELDVSAVQL